MIPDSSEAFVRLVNPIWLLMLAVMIELLFQVIAQMPENVIVVTLSGQQVYPMPRRPVDIFEMLPSATQDEWKWCPEVCIMLLQVQVLLGQSTTQTATSQIKRGLLKMAPFFLHAYMQSNSVEKARIVSAVGNMIALPSYASNTDTILSKDKPQPQSRQPRRDESQYLSNCVYSMSIPTWFGYDDCWVSVHAAKASVIVLLRGNSAEPLRKRIARKFTEDLGSLDFPKDDQEYFIGQVSLDEQMHLQPIKGSFHLTGYGTIPYPLTEQTSAGKDVCYKNPKLTFSGSLREPKLSFEGIVGLTSSGTVVAPHHKDAAIEVKIVCDDMLLSRVAYAVPSNTSISAVEGNTKPLTQVATLVEDTSSIQLATSGMQNTDVLSKVSTSTATQMPVIIRGHLDTDLTFVPLFTAQTVPGLPSVLLANYRLDPSIQQQKALHQFTGHASGLFISGTAKQQGFYTEMLSTQHIVPRWLGAKSSVAKLEYTPLRNYLFRPGQLTFFGMNARVESHLTANRMVISSLWPQTANVDAEGKSTWPASAFIGQKPNRSSIITASISSQIGLTNLTNASDESGITERTVQALRVVNQLVIDDPGKPLHGAIVALSIDGKEPLLLQLSPCHIQVTAEGTVLFNSRVRESDYTHYRLTIDPEDEDDYYYQRRYSEEDDDEEDEGQQFNFGSNYNRFDQYQQQQQQGHHQPQNFSMGYADAYAPTRNPGTVNRMDSDRVDDSFEHQNAEVQQAVPKGNVLPSTNSVGQQQQQQVQTNVMDQQSTLNQQTALDQKTRDIIAQAAAVHLPEELKQLAKQRAQRKEAKLMKQKEQQQQQEQQQKATLYITNTRSAKDKTTVFELPNDDTIDRDALIRLALPFPRIMYSFGTADSVLNFPLHVHGLWLPGLRFAGVLCEQLIWVHSTATHDFFETLPTDLLGLSFVHIFARDKQAENKASNTSSYGHTGPVIIGLHDKKVVEVFYVKSRLLTQTESNSVEKSGSTSDPNQTQEEEEEESKVLIFADLIEFWKAGQGKLTSANIAWFFEKWPCTSVPMSNESARTIDVPMVEDTPEFKEALYTEGLYPSATQIAEMQRQEAEARHRANMLARANRRASKNQIIASVDKNVSVADANADLEYQEPVRAFKYPLRGVERTPPSNTGREASVLTLVNLNKHQLTVNNSLVIFDKKKNRFTSAHDLNLHPLVFEPLEN